MGQFCKRKKKTFKQSQRTQCLIDILAIWQSLHMDSAYLRTNSKVQEVQQTQAKDGKSTAASKEATAETIILRTWLDNQSSSGIVFTARRAVKRLKKYHIGWCHPSQHPFINVSLCSSCFQSIFCFIWIWFLQNGATLECNLNLHRVNAAKK